MQTLFWLTDSQWNEVKALAYGLIGWPRLLHRYLSSGQELPAL
jgi:hypothetical protein